MLFTEIRGQQSGYLGDVMASEVKGNLWRFKKPCSTQAARISYIPALSEW